MIIIGGRYLKSEELLNLGIKSCGSNVLVHESCQLIGAENISLGNNVRIDPWCILAAVNNHITIGSFVHIGAYCYLSGGAGIELHDFSGLSQRVSLYSMTDDYLGGGLTNPTVPKKYLNIQSGKIILERHVIIGSSTVILPNVCIHRGASVGALSLVKKSLEPWGIYFGVPVKRLRDRQKDIIERYEEEVLQS